MPLIQIVFDRKNRSPYMVLAGANREGDTPVPIPNTEVKPLIADGTAEFALWESRTVPHSTHTAIKRPRFGGVFYALTRPP